MRQINRIQPKLPVQLVKTYGILAPRTTHYRKATCEEVNCKAFMNGWSTTLDESVQYQRNLAEWIRSQREWKYRDTKDEHGKTVFWFPAGQKCFNYLEHEKRLDRPELYIVRGGDWRANTGVIRRHDKGEHWVEDFAEHTETLANAQR